MNETLKNRAVRGPGAVLCCLLAVLALALAVPETASADPPDDPFALNEDVMQHDISVQVIDKIFGAGWQNIADVIGGSGTGKVNEASMDGLIYKLLYVLNSCCAIIVAWLFLLTTLSATLGAAQDGSGIGGRRYSNAWIPLRYSFAMGAVTPVFNGMNAMQVMVLACLGMSINFADNMWATAIDSVKTVGAIAPVANPDTHAAAGRAISVMVEHAAVRAYLEEHEGCTFKNEPRDIRQGSDGDNYIYQFELPFPDPGQKCTAGGFFSSTPKTAIGDFGMITVSTANQKATEAIANFIRGTLYNTVLNTVKEIMADPEKRSVTDLKLETLVHEYVTNAAIPLSMAASGSRDTNGFSAKAIEEFTEYAKLKGWFMAGSYYWTIAKLSADAVAFQHDGTTAQNLSPAALKQWKTPDLERAYMAGVELAQQAQHLADRTVSPKNPLKNPALVNQVSETPAIQYVKNSSVYGQLQAAFGQIPRVLTEMVPVKSDGSQDSIEKSAIKMVEGSDMVFNMVRTARGAMNIAEEAILTYFTVNVGTSIGAGLLRDIPFLGGAIEKGQASMQTIAAFVAVIAAPLWAFCWFYAYMLPMIPFIAWFTAVLGWVVLTMEAVVACPVWLVGHCMPDGDGFAGASARAGYALFMSILLRPLLLIISFFICMIIMTVSGTLVGKMFAPFVDSLNGTFAAEGVGGTGLSITASISMIILLGTIISIATWKLFTLVTSMPDRIIRWAGQLLKELGDRNPEQTVAEASSKMKSIGATVAGISLVGPATTIGRAVGDSGRPVVNAGARAIGIPAAGSSQGQLGQGNVGAPHGGGGGGGGAGGGGGGGFGGGGAAAHYGGSTQGGGGGGNASRSQSPRTTAGNARNTEQDLFQGAT